jgi:hypothetical protein
MADDLTRYHAEVAITVFDGQGWTTARTIRLAAPVRGHRGGSGQPAT